MYASPIQGSYMCNQGNSMLQRPSWRSSFFDLSSTSFIHSAFNLVEVNFCDAATFLRCTSAAQRQCMLRCRRMKVFVHDQGHHQSVALASHFMHLYLLQGPCSLTDAQALDGVNDNFGVVLSSRWHGVYALVAMLVIWRCLHAAFLYTRVRLWY